MNKLGNTPSAVPKNMTSSKFFDVKVYLVQMAASWILNFSDKNRPGCVSSVAADKVEIPDCS